MIVGGLRHEACCTEHGFNWHASRTDGEIDLSHFGQNWKVYLLFPGLQCRLITIQIKRQLECGPMPNLMVALPNIGGAHY